MITILLLIAIWIGCWIASTGLMFAEMHSFGYSSAFSLNDDRFTSLIMGIFGPASLIAALAITLPNWNKRQHNWLWPWGRTLRKIRVIAKLRENNS